MLGEYVFPKLDDIEMKKGTIYFQKKGAVPQYSLRVQEALAIITSDVDGQAGKNPWPLRMRDLTS